MACEWADPEAYVVALGDESSVSSSRAPEFAIEHRERKRRRDPRRRGSTQISMVAGPPILGRILDETRADWVQVNVSKDFEQVRIRLHKQREIAALEQMPGRFEPGLHRPRVTTGDLQHELSKRDVTYLDQCVEVVRHPAVSVHACIELQDRFRHD
jgi:hypothetical protein